MESSFLIHIKTLDSQVYDIDAQNDMLVLQVKEKLTIFSGLSVPEQRLIYRGKVLKDEYTLLFYGIKHEHTIHLVKHTPLPPPQESQPAPFSLQTNQLDQTSPVHPQPFSQIMVGSISLPVNNGNDIHRVIYQIMNTFGLPSPVSSPDIPEQPSHPRPLENGYSSTKKFFENAILLPVLHLEETLMIPRPLENPCLSDYDTVSEQIQQLYSLYSLSLSRIGTVSAAVGHLFRDEAGSHTSADRQRNNKILTEVSNLLVNLSKYSTLLSYFGSHITFGSLPGTIEPSTFPTIPTFQQLQTHLGGQSLGDHSTSATDTIFSQVASSLPNHPFLSPTTHHSSTKKDLTNFLHKNDTLFTGLFLSFISPLSEEEMNRLFTSPDTTFKLILLNKHQRILCEYVYQKACSGQPHLNRQNAINRFSGDLRKLFSFEQNLSAPRWDSLFTSHGKKALRGFVHDRCKKLSTEFIDLCLDSLDYIEKNLTNNQFGSLVLSMCSNFFLSLFRRLPRALKLGKADFGHVIRLFLTQLQIISPNLDILFHTAFVNFVDSIGGVAGLFSSIPSTESSQNQITKSTTSPHSSPPKPSCPLPISQKFRGKWENVIKTDQTKLELSHNNPLSDSYIHSSPSFSSSKKKSNKVPHTSDPSIFHTLFDSSLETEVPNIEKKRKKDLLQYTESKFGKKFEKHLKSDVKRQTDTNSDYTENKNKYPFTKKWLKKP